jgi:uncharacterized protein with PIN domain
VDFKNGEREMNQAAFRFYAELNDFLTVHQRQRTLFFPFIGNPSVKDSIEAFGVPHTEVDLVLVNGNPVNFRYHVQNQDYISVYPVFECLDISALVKLRAKPLRVTRFVADVHLGKLARKLRLFGFDTLYKNDFSDAEIIRLSLKDKRIILTRDRGILMNGSVSHGYWIRSFQVDEQLSEVLNRFHLVTQIKAFHRCTVCNGTVKRIDKKQIRDQLLPRTTRYYNEFFTCVTCKRIYWKGSHYRKMESYIQNMIRNCEVKQASI